MKAIGFLFFTVVLVGVLGQRLPSLDRMNALLRSRQNNVPHPNPQVVTHEGNGASSGEGPVQNWRDLVATANNGVGVSTVDDFLSLLVTADGRHVSENDIFSPYGTVDGKRVVTGGGLLASSDECSPRNVSVRLPLNYTDSQVGYYPECTLMQRCGGCTQAPTLSCEPLYKEKIVLKVLRARYLYPGALSMRWEGFETVEVERHLSCRAVCVLSPGDCGTLKQFLPNQCKCQCRRTQECSNQQKWDENTCSCRCQNERPCCEEGDTACTYFFDHRICGCTLKQAIGASVDATQEEIDAWLAGNNPDGLGPSGSADVPQPETTVTEEPTTTTNPCASRPCPNGFIRRMNAGRCVCVLSMRRSRTRRYPNSG